MKTLIKRYYLKYLDALKADLYNLLKIIEKIVVKSKKALKIRRPDIKI